MSTNWCRLCQLPIAPGEDVIHDPQAYWAHHVDIHICCAENAPDPSDPAYVEARAEAGVPSRAMPRGRQLKVSQDRL